MLELKILTELLQNPKQLLTKVYMRVFCSSNYDYEYIHNWGLSSNFVMTYTHTAMKMQHSFPALLVVGVKPAFVITSY